MIKLLLALSFLGSSSTFYAPITEVVVVDGDTIRIEHIKVRLFGMDSPEIGQKGGQDAREHLKGIIAHATLITCRVTSLDRYGRSVAKCYTINGQDICRAMVRDGYALAYEKYSDEYSDDQEFAEENNLGEWRNGGIEPPWVYRAKKRKN